MAKFDEGAVRFTKSEYPDSLGMKGEKIFVMPGSEFDRIINESGDDLNKLDDLLSFGGGLKTTTSDDWDMAFISNPKVQIPTGNESGAYPNQWIPGGFTGGGVAEAVMDHPASSDILRCSFIEVMNNSRCL